MFTFTVFEMLLFDGRLVLAPAQWGMRGTGSERVNMKSDIMAKLNIHHLFATALVLIRSQRRKREKNKRRGRRY